MPRRDPGKAGVRNWGEERGSSRSDSGTWHVSLCLSCGFCRWGGKSRVAGTSASPVPLLVPTQPRAGPAARTALLSPAVPQEPAQARGSPSHLLSTAGA